MTPEQKRAIALANARRRREAEAPALNPDGLPSDIYQPGDPWSGFDPARDAFLNPATGQMTTREMLANSYQPGVVRSGVAGGAQGVAMGGSDELAGAAGAVLGPVFGMGGTMGDRYRFMQEDTRAELDAARRDNPVAAYGGEIAGAVLSPVNKLMPGAGATTTAGKIGAGAGAGALGGGLYGFMSADGGMVDRGMNGAGMAFAGGVLGGGVPAAMDGARKAGSIAMGAMGRASGTGAASYVDDLIRRAGKTPQQLDAEIAAASSDGQPGYMLADALGATGQSALSGVTRQPGNARQIVTDLLNGRQEGQGRRISTFLADHFGFNGQPGGVAVPNTPESVLGAGTTSAAKLTDDLTQARSTAANAAYGASRADAGAVNIDGVVAKLDDRLSGTKGGEFARDEVDNLFQQTRDRLVSQNGDQTMMLSDYDRLLRVKQAMGDQIGELVRAGKNYAAGQLKDVQRELDAALEAASSGYRKANDDFRAASRVVDAVETGQKMPSVGRATDNLRAWDGLGPTEQSAARIGYGDNLMGKIGGQSSTRNKAANFSPDDIRQEIAAIAQDPGGFFRKVDRENTMFTTKTRATGGSMTADNQGDVAEAAARNMPMVMNLLSGRFGALGQQVADKLVSAGTGRNEATREIIAQLLTGQTPSQAVAPALASAAKRAATDGKVGRVVRPAANAIIAQLLSGR